MKKLDDSLERMVEDRIAAVRRKMLEPEAPAVDAKPGQSLSPDFVAIMKWRIQVMRMIVELEEFVKKGRETTV